MNYELRILPISKLLNNSGQLKGVPKNPRTIKDARFNALKKSIEDAPEMLSLRELIVVPFGDKFVTICGNMRLSAARDLGMKSMPCKVLAEDTPAEKLREYAMKDNIAFGQDDIDLILAEWDSEELAEWGFELPEELLNPSQFSDTFTLDSADKLPFEQMTFTLADIQAEEIKEAIEKVKQGGVQEYYGNTNTNGNAIYEIVKQWADVKK